MRLLRLRQSRRRCHCRDRRRACALALCALHHKLFDRGVLGIVSLKRMSQMEGFDKLTAIERNALVIRKDNLVLMDASANSSKGERSWAVWVQASTFYHPDVIAAWTARDAGLTKTIREWILATVRGR